MSAYTQFQTLKTPQSQPIPGSKQVLNNAGGYVFELDKWKQLERFLILGTEGGTYYVSEKSLTANNAHAAMACIQADGKRAVDLVVSVSDSGRAPKNDPALLVLALAASATDVETRTYALSKLSKVARIPTHLFHFAEYVKQHRGWGPTLHKAIQNWYNGKPVDLLAHQMVKYQQRDGWSHRDMLRKARPKTADEQRNNLYRWACHGVGGSKGVSPTALIPTDVAAFEAVKRAETIQQVVDAITMYRLDREMLPTEALTHPEVWGALLDHMPMTAMIRNLGNMSKVGILKPFSTAEKLIVNNLQNVELIQKSRLHPYAILLAARTYAKGKGVLGKGEWTPCPAVVDALDDAFYASFKFIQPTGKRFLIGVDVSGSMSDSVVGGVLSCAEGAAAMAMSIARVEPQVYIHGFCHQFVDLGITAKTTLPDALKRTRGLNFGATDCALPALFALEKKLDVDAIVIVTDNETWVGHTHPKQALIQYRHKTGIPVKQVVIGMATTNFTIADPDDPLSLDVVGFDASVPQTLQEFVR